MDRRGIEQSLGEQQEGEEEEENEDEETLGKAAAENVGEGEEGRISIIFFERQRVLACTAERGESVVIVEVEGRV